MAALTEARDTVEAAAPVRTVKLPVKAKTTIFAGAFVAVDETGHAVPAEAAEDLTAAGRAEYTADNLNGEDGGQEVEVRRGCFKWENSASDPVDETCILKECYMEDDQTVAKTATGTSVAGRVLAVTENGVLVETW